MTISSSDYSQWLLLALFSNHNTVLQCNTGLHEGFFSGGGGGVPQLAKMPV